jgi:hypothetical protein
MIKQKENPALAFVGTCYRGINITKGQLNQFKEHLKNIITFSAFTSTTVSELIAIRFMLDYDDTRTNTPGQINQDERVPILFKINVKKETAI